MKRIFTLFLTLTCLTAFLTGCGSKGSDQAASEDPAGSDQQAIPAYTPDEIAENNRIENLLARHDAVTYVRTYIDHDNQVVSEICRQYEMRNGQLQMNSVQNDGENNVLYRQQAYADDTYPAAEYDMTDEGQMFLTLYTSEDAYNSVVGTWLMIDGNSSEETVTDTSMQDDAVIVTTRKDYGDDAGFYDICLYYIDPETGDLLYTEDTSYGSDDNAFLSSTKTEITYDAPISFDVSPFEAITGSSDFCEVSLIIDPQQDDMKVCWYPVAHGTSVYVVTDDGTVLYSDEALTQEVNPYEIDISGSTCNLFAVFGN